MQLDNKLGQEIHEFLLSKGLEHPLRKTKKGEKEENKLSNIEACVHDVLDTLGLDLNDESISDTPKRVSKMYVNEVFSGLDYNTFPKCTTTSNSMNFDEIVCVKNIVLRSTCEHHLQPIYGHAHIAYIPGKLVLGLSKFARVADFFASRPQVQERLTEQIHAALQYILKCDDIAVVIEAEHFCMKMRGVKDPCSATSTSKMSGRFRSDPNARREVLSLMKGLS